MYKSLSLKLLILAFIIPSLAFAQSRQVKQESKELPPIHICISGDSQCFFPGQPCISSNGTIGMCSGESVNSDLLDLNTNIHFEHCTCFDGSPVPDPIANSGSVE